jgi:hypothetical protein
MSEKDEFLCWVICRWLTFQISKELVKKVVAEGEGANTKKKAKNCPVNYKFKFG